jgi:hypothetical protein
VELLTSSYYSVRWYSTKVGWYTVPLRGEALFSPSLLVTKNGYGDIVIMSMKVYKEKMFMSDIYHKLNAAEEQLAEGKVLDGDESLKKIKEKFNV